MNCKEYLTELQKLGFTTIETMILAYAPVIIALLGIIAACLKIVKIIKSMKNENADRDAKINQVIQENYELKALCKELLTKIDHIKRD